MKKWDFNRGWTFRKGDGAALSVTLPHDAMQTEARGAGNPSGSGCAWYGGGAYTYEKTFTAPEDWAGKSVLFEFEAAYPMARVWLNGEPAGGCDYGYEQFLVPGEELKIGGENVLRVEVDNTSVPNSRWYSGAGLIRPAFAYVGEREHIEPRGVRVKTLSVDPARVEVTVRHTGEAPARVEILDGGTVLAAGVGDRLTLDVPGARLWSAENPNLYLCRAALPSGDTESVKFGIRVLAWDKEGFRVNGKTVKLRGGCVHHDNGILGARSYYHAELRRVKILKSAGFNAIRSSHYPASRSLLEACDRVGMYVMDEGWDMWYFHKTPGDYAGRFMDNWERDLEAMVDKDFSHPSVVMYSIGNEVSEPVDERGLKLARDLVEKLHSLDDTRPVTSGANLAILLSSWRRARHIPEVWEGGDNGSLDSETFNALMEKQFLGMLDVAATDEADAASSPYFDLLDIAGYNYASPRYPMEATRHPDRLIVGSETFPFMLAENWEMVEKFPYLIGDFMWTAWDYLGETGIGAWSASPDANVFGKPYPWLLADTGAFDILGHDNAEAGLATVVWGARSEPYLGVAPPLPKGTPVYRAPWRGTDAVPHWSWRGREGMETRVEIYTKAPMAALYLNGRLLGKEKVERCRAVFTVPYAPGELRGAAMNEAGEEISAFALRSASGKLTFSLKPEGKPIPGEPFYIGLDILGENGEIECGSDARCRVTVTGGELLAFGSADPRTESRFEDGEYETYHGRAQIVVLPETGPLTVKARAEGFEDAVLTI